MKNIYMKKYMFSARFCSGRKHLFNVTSWMDEIGCNCKASTNQNISSKIQWTNEKACYRDQYRSRFADAVR